MIRDFLSPQWTIRYFSYLMMLSVSCWVHIFILFWASMCVMVSVLSPLIARMVSPGHRSPWAALLPGVICNYIQPHTHPNTPREKKTAVLNVKRQKLKLHKHEASTQRPTSQQIKLLGFRIMGLHFQKPEKIIL